ncbi:unnamed protein product, partial [Pylaiella littoralis]
MEGRRPRHLSSCTLDSVAKAVDAFEENDGLLLCQIRPSAISKFAPFFTVPEGYYALVQRGGQFEDFRGSSTWPAGLHFGPPWMRVSYLVTKQSMVYHCNVKHCITRDNIPILVRATVVLRVMGDAEKGEDPALVRKFVHEVGVRGLEAQLVNAVAEAIRVMARATLHKAVYALPSGAGAVGSGRPRRPSTPHLPLTVWSTPTPVIVEKKRESGTAAVPAAERVRRVSSMKRVKVVPDQDFSDPKLSAEPLVAGADPVDTAAAVNNAASSSSTAVESMHEQPASPASSSSPLPVIQRGLRASRIFPVTDADNSSEGSPRRLPEGESAASPLERTTSDRRRVHPSGSLLIEGGQEIQGLGEELGGDGGSDGGSERRAATPKRRISELPALINLDLSSSLIATSSTSTLPPLELEVVTLPSLPPTPSSPTNGRAKMAPGGEIKRAEEPENEQGGKVEGNEFSAEEAAAAAAAAAAAPGAEARAGAEAGTEPAELKINISLGRQRAEEIRDRLSRTFSPQGVEVTTVMLRSAELPSHIADQMSGRTLNASLAKEHRAVKESESQRVRHEGEVLGLRQRWEIEKALVLREGGLEILKAKDKLARLRAQANATVRAVAAESASAMQRLSSQAQREISHSCLKETAVVSSKASSSDRAAGIVKAEASAFRALRESEAHLEVAQNQARARGLVDTAEGDGAPMLRAARTHDMEEKRLQASVLDSLSNNVLALVVASPLLTANSSSSSSAGRRAGEGTTTTTTSPLSLRPKQTVDALTALLLGEAGFKAQALGQEEARRAPPSAASTGTKGNGNRSSERLELWSWSSASSSSSIVGRRGRMELGVQMVLARALGGGTSGGRAGSSASSSPASWCSSFAVRLNPKPTSSAKRAGG